MNREEIVPYFVRFQEPDFENPLTIGNGNFAFTCDFSGLQTFAHLYRRLPLCTMSSLIWALNEVHDELPYQSFIKSSDGQPIRYLSLASHPSFSEYRKDCFRFDLFHLEFFYFGKRMSLKKFHLVDQQLDLYQGKIHTVFSYLGKSVAVTTKIPQKHHCLKIDVQSELPNLSIRLVFYRESEELCGRTEELADFIVKENYFERKNDHLQYRIYYQTDMKVLKNEFTIEKCGYLFLSLDGSFEDDDEMQRYYQKIPSLKVEDQTLKRRWILSLYLLKVNTLGIYPPSETGLTCNSWYSKFHLEMHLWHHLGMIRMGAYEEVYPSLLWYLSIAESSEKRAKFQGYQGLRLPKMTDFRGEDSPSEIGCFLVWQMPHLLVMLEEIYQQSKDIHLLEPFFPFVKEQIRFIESFFYLKDGKYHLDRPMICACEKLEPDKDTPIFELAYFLYALKLWKTWVNRFSLSDDLNRLEDILSHACELPTYQGCYEAYVGATDTYRNYCYDHPMVLGMYSFFKSDLVDPEMMKNTLEKVLKNWDFSSCWGWDFPMMAMCAYHLNLPQLATEILKMDTPKNTYTKVGHNPQGMRKDLPCYFPGNGAFILAMSVLFAKK